MTASNALSHMPATLAWRDPSVVRRVGDRLDQTLAQVGVDHLLKVLDDPLRGAPIPAALPYSNGLVAVLRRAVGFANLDGEERVAPAHLGQALRGDDLPAEASAATIDATPTVARFLDEATDRAFAEGASEVRLAHLISAVRAEVDARRQTARAA